MSLSLPVIAVLLHFRTMTTSNWKIMRVLGGGLRMGLSLFIIFTPIEVFSYSAMCRVEIERSARRWRRQFFSSFQRVLSDCVRLCRRQPRTVQ